MAAKCWGRRNDKTLLNGYGLLCWADRNALELDTKVEGCPTLFMHQVSLNYTL